MLLQRAKASISSIQGVPILRRFSRPSARTHSPEELEGFRNAQRLAYECAVHIGRELRPGWTERRTAQLMDQFLRDSGVRSFFHKSFVWFGDRTRFTGMTNPLHFLPTNRELSERDVIILDTAPVVNGYTADIGFTFSLTEHPELAKARRFLLEQRTKIADWFSGTCETVDVWRREDEELSRAGYDNCHARYPFGVLGHRLHRSRFPDLGLKPFGGPAYWGLLTRGLLPELLGEFHRGAKIGLWAIEPHLGANGFGAKFEEILVVEKQRAYWLSDSVPHKKLPAGFF